jgi:hypothetical protein
MKRFTQKEILTEGFWDGFKPRNWGRVAKGAIRMGADALRMVAPEITNPLDKVDQARWGLKNSFEQGYGGVPDQRQTQVDAKQKMGNAVAKSVHDNITIGLASQNLKLIPKDGIRKHGVDPSNGNDLYILKVSSPKNQKGEWMVVNAKGIRQ